MGKNLHIPCDIDTLAYFSRPTNDTNSSLFFIFALKLRDQRGTGILNMQPSASSKLHGLRLRRTVLLVAKGFDL